MGILLKVLLFGLVFYYLLKTVGGFVFRLMGGQPPQRQQRSPQQQRREGDINIDYAPKNRQKKSRTGPKEGDYIDYEEVK